MTLEELRNAYNTGQITLYAFLCGVENLGIPIHNLRAMTNRVFHRIDYEYDILNDYVTHVNISAPSCMWRGLTESGLQVWLRDEMAGPNELCDCEEDCYV